MGCSGIFRQILHALDGGRRCKREVSEGHNSRKGQGAGSAAHNFGFDWRRVVIPAVEESEATAARVRDVASITSDELKACVG